MAIDADNVEDPAKCDCPWYYRAATHTGTNPMLVCRNCGDTRTL